MTSPAAGSPRRSGRRAGNPGTREQILVVARAMFAERGYDRTSVRAVAAGAEVDPALVHHYFGTKEQLLLAVMQAPVDPQAVLAGVVAGGRDGAGDRLIRAFLGLWESDRGEAMVGVLRSAVASEDMAGMLRGYLVFHVLTPTLAALGVPKDQVEPRAALLATQLAGLALTRYVLRFDAVLHLSVDELVAAIGPTLQRYVDGPL